eukprot:2942551-Rhodomonas_salina.3
MSGTTLAYAAPSAARNAVLSERMLAQDEREKRLKLERHVGSLTRWQEEARYNNTLPAGPVLWVKDLRGKELEVPEQPDAANLGEVMDGLAGHAYSVTWDCPQYRAVPRYRDRGRDHVGWWPGTWC